MSASADGLRDMARAWVNRDGLQHFRADVLDHARIMGMGWSEVLLDTETAHRLLDWLKVPDGQPQGGGDIDSRVAVLAWRTMGAEASLSAIASAHVQGQAAGGMVDGYCIECDRAWPCPTSLWATGQRDSNACWDPRDDEDDAVSAQARDDQPLGGGRPRKAP